ncbi:hypothetical protein BH23BAC1_BH23BAC1_27240 [soil metagenome]
MDDHENFIILVNLSPDDLKVEIDLEKLGYTPSSQLIFSDILNGNDFKIKKREKEFNIPMEG